MMSDALYIHIPFCEAICSYCDFCKVYYQKDIANTYLQRLQEEIASLAISSPLRTLYIGGGTPSSLNEMQLQKLMNIIKPYINKHTEEITIEVNPESMNRKKLHILKAGGVNRLSVGVQTFNESILHTLERKHTNPEVFSLLQEAHALGITNLSIDLMYGLPNQTMEDIKQDIEIVKTLPITHLSYYSLILEEHTQLRNIKFQGISQALEEEMYQYIDSSLEALGFSQYEVSNYAKADYMSKHNLVYWKYDNYFGVGIGATAKMGDTMYVHNRNIYAYIEGKDTVKIEILSKEDSLFNHIMMSLRILEGLDIEKVNNIYHIDFLQRYAQVIAKYKSRGWLYIENNKLHCSKQSLRFLHEILLEFLD